MKRSILAVCCATLLASGTPAGSATTYFVATTGTDNGTCGGSNAPCRTVQFALDKAVDGDTVRVRNGTYHECVFVSALVGVGAITLVADQFANNGTIGGAILDGDTMCGPATPFPGPVATVEEKSILRGFTIKNGGDSGIWGFGAVQITSNNITGNSTTLGAGGLFLYTGLYLEEDDDAKMEIKANSISENTAVFDGGGLLLLGLADGTASVVEIQDNTFSDNVVGPDPDASSIGSVGGAIAVYTDATDGSETSVIITRNTIDGNTAHIADNGTAGYGGGIFVATGAYGGYGKETVTIGATGGNGNSIRNGQAEGYGGGVSVFVQPGLGGEHAVSISSNSITANSAALGGGGIHASFFTDDPDNNGTGAFDIEANAITGNHAPGLAGPGVLGGGGIFAEMYVNRTPATRAHFRIAHNTIGANDSGSFGGGASLFASASDDPEGNGATAPAEAVIEFWNNVVASNIATSDGGADPARGGGVWAAARAFGDTALGKVDHNFLTVYLNSTEIGGGGLEWDALSEQNSLGTFGKVAHTLNNSIVAFNAGIEAGAGLGVRGTFLPGADIAVDIRYSDGYQNEGGDWDPNFGVAEGVNGIVSVDPELDFFDLSAPQCSATIDIGDPASDFTLEPEPNGGRVNLGYQGGSPDATRTFPDANGDGIVDGLDILRLAVAFNAVSPDPRYNAAVDLDRNLEIDGSDLAYLAASYARTCP